MTKSSSIFLNVHLKRAKIEFEFMPEIPNYIQKYKVYATWTSKEISGHLEYDRKSTLYIEKSTLCKIFIRKDVNEPINF